MHDVGDALVRAGFSDVVMDSETLTITYPDVHALRQELKHLGAANVLRHAGVHSQTQPSLRGRGFLQRLNEQLQANPAEPISISLEIVYGHAWASGAGASRTRPGSIAPIHLG